MIINQLLKKIGYLLIGLVFSANVYSAVTDISNEPLNTYSVTTSTDVKPNIFFVLDDSGSMDWDFMPDWACASVSTRNPSCNYIGQVASSAGVEYLFKSASYNGIYYNPQVTYTPPIAVNSSGISNTTTYPSMVGTSTATGGDSSATSTSKNWKAVKDDAYGIQATTTSNLINSADYFTIVPGLYCPSASLTNTTTVNCINATTASTSNSFPAPVRWCDSSALTNCRAAFGGTFTWVSAPSPSTATIPVSVSSSTSVSQITVNGLKIMTGATTASSTSSTVASGIVTQINACTYAITGSCQVVGYSASRSGSVVTISAPTAITSTPIVTQSGSTLTPSAFAASAVPGQNLRTVITSTVNSYPYPGTSSKAATRTDCAGATCTYAEEMTNYANWWTYYRTRMQMMKSAASNAFGSIDNATDIANGVSRFRLGYMSINNNTGADFVNLGEFTGAQKGSWYNRLLQANPGNSTPLRAALSTAGRLYAGVLTSVNGIAATDPLQYSCQQNYTIMSTDGFWNESSGFNKLNGSTNVGNQDSALARPYYDGGAGTLQSSSSTLQSQTVSTKGKKGAWMNASSCTSSSSLNCQYTAWTAYSNMPSCTALPQSTSSPYTVGTAIRCQSIITGGTSNTLADVAAYYYNTDLRNATATSPDATGTCVGPIIAPATTPNDLCADNVPQSGRDVAVTQHMVTFTLGLGSQGQMIYAPNDGKDYWNDTSGDFHDVYKAISANPSTGICSWQTSGPCNWPTPTSNSNANIDDLWHAAINGHGTYFSARDPSTLSASFNQAFDVINSRPRPGTAAAAASSNPNVSVNDNYVFSSSYKSILWYGELVRQQIDVNGNLTAQNWSAMNLLDCATTPWQASHSYLGGDVYSNGTKCYNVLPANAYVSGTSFGATDTSNTVVVNVDANAPNETPPGPLVPATPLATRKIYIKSGTSLIDFQWATLPAGLSSYFTAPAITYVSASAGLSQFCSTGVCLTAAQQSNTTIATGGAAGEALVKYIRGDRTNEGTYYRQRTHVLGDIVSSEASYVKAPILNYADAGYSDYKTLKASRNGAVYVGANDGMLHAFDATTGQENWAYIPSQVIPNLYKLADMNYKSQHQYYVDASPETGDICPNAPSSTCSGSQWKSILVGGLNAGGKGYYALDVTDPATPILLWEFTDANMGYTYGNPKITKLKDGTWVVLVSSGYNNADGVGRLYVLNANTGVLIRTISTGVGTAATPSGLSRISAHAPTATTDNTSIAAYGGDTLGNLWRFDINGDIGAAGYDAQRLISFTNAAGVAEPITVKPLEATINGFPIIYVGTGRYLGTSDVSNTSNQSFYAVKDKLDTTTYGNPRIAGNGFVQQTLSNTTCTTSTFCSTGQVVRTSTDLAVDWTNNNGWFIDFLGAGERSTSDASLALGTLLFTTITPQPSNVLACGTSTAITPNSFLYALNYLTGGPVATTGGISAVSLGASLVTRPVIIEQADGTVRTLIRTSGGVGGSATDLGGTIVLTPPIIPSSSSITRRSSWRELNGQ